MPTVGWIQETGVDRLWERGSEPGTSALPTSYACRHCSQVFETRAAREQHELEHPLPNPTLFFRDRELGSSRLLITSTLQADDIDARNISRLTLNGRQLDSVAELTQTLQSVTQDLFSLTYGNDALEKHLKIEVCIASTQQLAEVDQAFRLCFAAGSLADPLLTAFSASVKHCNTVSRYVDGLMRYLHGLKAKDQQSDITTFEDFDKRFNQAVDSLKSYNTPLATAVRAVIRFNRNDFSLLHSASGLPDLDRAIAFFQGKALTSGTSASPDAQLPVDQSTAFILTTLIPVFFDSSLAAFEERLAWLPAQCRSLQDTSKLNYLCLRKAIAEDDTAASTRYRQKLRHDDVFNTLLGAA
ncbi:hypothetical protein P3C80_30755 [Pseudomonas aeruginosa]|uniref:hypothetical protein n=1 Tax=Pseudomonas aeruginosa TaxID=287 RepID=UPI0021F20354|nr:hypothetical protein [Pseudomonas aeruginosa]MCV6104755.1 hypothetical protein [Pseudomonas aeruginosa]MDI2201423.1 hypothetical protein [Pseudomonas aeruginosa]HBO3958487.1 hypothetical protein [Pseudomonas aeruginosa]HCF6076479.1 hypothetical protein [Pseudomonas aeruginosa]HEP8278279.1 hypothetical protein [Pseudomonas aeruginosa]